MKFLLSSSSPILNPFEVLYTPLVSITTGLPSGPTSVLFRLLCLPCFYSVYPVFRLISATLISFKLLALRSICFRSYRFQSAINNKVNPINTARNKSIYIPKLTILSLYRQVLSHSWFGFRSKKLQIPQLVHIFGFQAPDRLIWCNYQYSGAGQSRV